MQYPWKCLRPLLGVPLLALAALPAPAQTSATVTVNAGTSSGTIPATAFGINTAVWDGALLDSVVPSLLKQAGTNVLRFPGGSTSDVYHWQTHSVTGGGYVTPGNTFDAFMGTVQQAGATPLITVNYGSNAAGNAGGDPNEAAAWVDYANNQKHYGVKYWEVGNEIYGNGEYGSAWEEDLHADHSPTAYGNTVVSYVNAMKAKDSTIKVGAVLTSPGDWPDGQSPDWNSAVLAACGTKIDFVIVHWYAQGPGSESDSGLLGSTSALAGKVAKLRSLISQYCGANAPNVKIFVTETNSVSYNPGKQSVSLVNGLFLADDYMTWLENGVANVDWWDLHNGAATGNNNSSSLYGTANYGDYGLLSSGQSGEPSTDTPFAPYYGLQMLTDLGKPGDQMVAASSSQSQLAVHAVKQAGGKLALLLINKSPSSSYTAGVSVSGYTPAAAATVYSYGKSSSAITSASGTASSSFTLTVPAYSLTTVVMTPGTGGTGGGTPPPPASDTAQYNFEGGTQSWAGSGGMITGVASSTTQAFAGTHALAVTIKATKADSQTVSVGSPSVPAGRPVTFHVWIPAGSAISSVQPYVQQGAGGGWTWTGNWQSISSLKTGAWNTLTVAVPSNAVTPLYQAGVQFATSAAWSGTAYVDSVSW